jgi:D-alanyl-lipoteichoic acid acyltransferase DltB (MBOAT superfamily)
MFISGIWHGAGWTFVIWGSLHGAALVANHLWRKSKRKMPAVLGWLLTFNFVNVSFVFFRAGSWDDALKVLRGMAGLSGIAFGRHSLEAVQAGEQSVLLLALALLLVLVGRNSVQMSEAFRPDWKHALLVTVLMAWGLLGLARVSEFLYFQF